MMGSDVVVIDYGMGNLFSVRRALEHCGAGVTVTDDHATIERACKVILPGVGAFANGMAELRRRRLDGVVKEFARSGKPLLGICLGMQMLLDVSTEFGVTTGLGLIPGRVVPVPATTAGGSAQKIPHIGWNALVPSSRYASWNGTVLQDTPLNASVYFVHSFMASPTEIENRLADCLYGDTPIAAVICRDNVYGCQFHPEKSGEVGLRILRSFIGMELPSRAGEPV